MFRGFRNVGSSSQGRAEMTTRTIEQSPQLYARIGGVLYLIIIVVGLFGEAFVRDRLVVPGDAAATATNIRSMESLWRFHIAAELFLLICAVALLMILFVLLKPVHRELALLAAFFNLVSIGLEAAITMYLLEALFPLGNAGYLTALDRKSTRLNSSHGYISYAVFCLTKKALNSTVPCALTRL